MNTYEIEEQERRELFNKLLEEYSKMYWKKSTAQFSTGCDQNNKQMKEQNACKDNDYTPYGFLRW